VLKSILLLIIIPMLLIPSFADDIPIECEDVSCIELCLLDPYCTLNPELELPQITMIQTDKSNYYVGDDITISGKIIDLDWNQDTTLTYEILKTNYIGIGSGLSNTLQKDGSFILTISWSEIESWGDYSGDILITINIQGASEGYTFYYSSQPDMTNESNYEKIMTHDLMLLSHDSMLYRQDNILTIYNQTQYNQSELIINLNELLNNQSNILTQQTEIINTQQIQFENFQDQLTFVSGYLTNLNATLGNDYPPILNDNAIKEVNKEIKRLVDEINQGDKIIADTLDELQEAINNDEPDKIIKLEDTLGSSILSREMAQSKLNMIYLYLDVYPQ